MLLLLLGCVDRAPALLTRADVEQAGSKGDVDTLCDGLSMADEDVRQLAATRLRDEPSRAASCVCDHLVYDSAWDRAVLRGLRGGAREDRVGCAAALLDDPALADRPGLAAALVPLAAPTVRARLAKAALSDRDAKVRAAAVPALAGTEDAAEIQALMEGLRGPDPAWAVAAAAVLAEVPSAAEALRVASVEAPDKAVRVAALSAWVLERPAGLGEGLCRAMNEDPAGDVRAAAIRLTRTTTDPAVLACLRTRSTTPEADPVVRKALLETLKAAPAPEAARILCDAVPYWVRTYVKDGPVDEQSDLDIFYFQNARDYDHSYACAQAALKLGGYSCWGRAYLGTRFRDYGGNTSWPACDGRGGSEADNHARNGD